MHARVRACVCARACISVKDRDIRWVVVCMCACRCIGGGDMVYGCGYEGGEYENSNYTCAENIAYY